MTRPYVFRTRWLVDEPPEPLWDTLEELLAQPDPMPWWGAVRVVGRGVDPGAAGPGQGDVVHLEARSAFGYRLRFAVHDLELERPTAMRLNASGDLVGHAALAFAPVGPAGSPRRTRLTIDWRVVATPAWMRRGHLLLRPVVVLGHGLIMRRGERRLNAWLATRRRR